MAKVSSAVVSVVVLPGRIQSTGLCETRGMPDNAVIRTTIPGPWGPFHLAATDRGVVAVAWLTTEPAFDAELAKRLHVPVENARDVPPTDPRRIHLDAGLAS